MSNIVGIIPARGGSVGVPLKNIKLLNGKPLIEYTIIAALESGALDRVIVSTDHQGIATVAKKCGAEVPFVRPADISEDVDTEFVLQHAIDFMEKSEEYSIDAVVLLQPTSPFRKSSTIKECVELYKNEPNADSVVSVNNIEGYRPEWMMKIDKKKVVPYASPFQHEGEPVIRLPARQSFPELHRMNGSVWVTSRDLLMNHNLVVGPNAYAIVTEEIEAVDIDTEVDFMISEALIQHREK